MGKEKQRRFGVMAILGLWLALALGLWLGPRHEVSAAERRKLEQFPSLTVQTLLDGRFMTKFETFTQDQFPLRESFRRLKAGFHYGLLRQLPGSGHRRQAGISPERKIPDGCGGEIPEHL